MEIHRDFPRLRRLVFPTPTPPSLVPKVSCQEGNEKANPSERLLIVSLSHSILAASIHLHPANIPRLDRSPCHTLSHRIILHALLCIVSHLLLFIYYPSAYLSTDRSINLSSDLLVSADHDNNNNNNSIKPQSQSSFQVKVSLGRVTVQRSAQTYPPSDRHSVLSWTPRRHPITDGLTIAHLQSSIRIGTRTARELQAQCTGAHASSSSSSTLCERPFSSPHYINQSRTQLQPTHVRLHRTHTRTATRLGNPRASLSGRLQPNRDNPGGPLTSRAQHPPASRLLFLIRHLGDLESKGPVSPVALGLLLLFSLSYSPSRAPIHPNPLFLDF